MFLGRACTYILSQAYCKSRDNSIVPHSICRIKFHSSATIVGVSAGVSNANRCSMPNRESTGSGLQAIRPWWTLPICQQDRLQIMAAEISFCKVGEAVDHWSLSTSITDTGTGREREGQETVTGRYRPVTTEKDTDSFLLGFRSNWLILRDYTRLVRIRCFRLESVLCCAGNENTEQRRVTRHWLNANFRNRYTANSSNIAKYRTTGIPDDCKLSANTYFRNIQPRHLYRDLQHQSGGTCSASTSSSHDSKYFSDIGIRVLNKFLREVEVRSMRLAVLKCYFK